MAVATNPVPNGRSAEASRTSSQSLSNLQGKNHREAGGACLNTRIGGADDLIVAFLTSLDTLYLGYNQIGSAGVESFAGVLVQCPTLAGLDLCFNVIGSSGAESIAGVLGQRLGQSREQEFLSNVNDKL